MKSLTHYLTESVQTYEYRIKIADEIDDKFAAKLERELGQFDLVKLSNPKKTPMQRSPYGFEGIENSEVYIIDVEFNYPAAPHQIQSIITRLGIADNRSTVSTKGADEQAAKELADYENNNKGDALLTAPYPDGDKEASKDYGTAYQNHVKNADKTKIEFASPTATPKAKTTNDLPTGTKSAMGSTKNKLPDVKSFAR
jgi:hypothetical protein